MADLNSASCDVCGTIKREQNHWFRVWIDPSYGWLIIAPWKFDPGLKHAHCCGEQHAVQKAGELLGKGGV